MAIGVPKSDRNHEKLISEAETFSPQNFRRGKIEIGKLSETHVAEVSLRSELSSRGERTFEVRSSRPKSYFTNPSYGSWRYWKFGGAELPRDSQ